MPATSQMTTPSSWSLEHGAKSVEAATFPFVPENSPPQVLGGARLDKTTSDHFNRKPSFAHFTPPLVTLPPLPSDAAHTASHDWPAWLLPACTQVIPGIRQLRPSGLATLPLPMGQALNHSGFSLGVQGHSEHPVKPIDVSSTHAMHLPGPGLALYDFSGQMPQLVPSSERPNPASPSQHSPCAHDVAHLLAPVTLCEMVMSPQLRHTPSKPALLG